MKIQMQLLKVLSQHQSLRPFFYMLQSMSSWHMLICIEFNLVVDHKHNINKYVDINDF